MACAIGLSRILRGDRATKDGYDAVLSIWLGDHALEEGLREGLLSLPKEEKEN